MSSPIRRPSPGPRPQPTPPATAPAPSTATAPAPSTATASAPATSATPVPATPSAASSEPARKKRPGRTDLHVQTGEQAEPRFDPSSWLGAIILMIVFVAVLWGVQVANASLDYSFNRFGLLPREVPGLWGVLTQPFLHATYRDMLSDTLPVLLLGWVLLLAGVRTWLTVTAVVVVVGGALTWLIGPGDTLVIGSSSLVFGWIGYLVARAIFSRKIRWIITAIMVLLIFGTLLGQLVPVSHSQQSWQAHAAGFVAGAAIGTLLHQRRLSGRAAQRAARRRERSTAVS